MRVALCAVVPLAYAHTSIRIHQRSLPLVDSSLVALALRDDGMLKWRRGPRQM